MRVLMLGWEFPPFISGGLGTACYGLTRAMSRRDVEVLFVLPRPVENATTHVRLLNEEKVSAPPTAQGAPGVPGESPAIPVATYELTGLKHITFKAIPSLVTNPYARAGSSPRASGMSHREDRTRERGGHGAEPLRREQPDASPAPRGDERSPEAPFDGYTGDLPSDAERYAERCVRLVGHERFDVIHAHDWMTFPAGLALAKQTGKPLVVHVHSTEYDRGGDEADPRVLEIERRGIQRADAVVCVSRLTRSICLRRHGAQAERTEVVYNGIESDGPYTRRATIERGEKVVLFLGRITRQKGPEHFMAAAQRVLEKVENVKFVMAGAGELAPRIMEMASELGIERRVLFTGFLRGGDVERVFRLADVYVMPSVSEPFGIAPLEAIRHDVPVIISRNSGVAEVLHHALKVDAWDADDVANKIIAVLRHPPLSRTLREQADLEVRRLTWDGAAARCLDVYQSVLAPRTASGRAEASPAGPSTTPATERA